MLGRFRKHWGIALFGLYALVTASVFLSNVVNWGWDARIFHDCTRALLEGRNPYTELIATGSPYKYPPWLIVVFIPWALFGETAFYWLWSLVLIASGVLIFRWVRDHGVRFAPAAWTFVAFNWIWFHNARYGQITLLVTALSLWLVKPGLTGAGSLRRPLSLAALVWTLTYKTLSVLPILGMWASQWLLPAPHAPDVLALKRPLLRNTPAALTAFAFLLLLSLPMASLLHDASVATVFQDWLTAMKSSSVHPEYDFAKTFLNPGLPATITRLLHVPRSQLNFDLWASVACMIVVGLWWGWRSRKLSWPVQWTGWLAAGVICHPLIWFHSFAFVYPFAALTVQAAWDSRDRTRRVVTFAALAGVTVLTRASLGAIGLKSLGIWLDDLSVKSLATLALMASWGVSSRKRV